MAIYSHSLDELVEMTCKNLLHDWAEGTATGGSAVTLDDTSRPEVADYWNSKGSWIYIRSGTYAGAYKKITDFVNGTGVITFTPTLAGNIVAGVTYSIHTDFPRDEVVSAINLAIDRVAEEALFWKIDETSITLVASQYEYELPTDFMFLHRVTMADTNGNFYGSPIDPSQYEIVFGSAPKIKFMGFPIDRQYEGHDWGSLWKDNGFVAGRLLRLEGLGSQSTLSTDSDTCAISPNYIIYQAAATLFLSRSRGSDSDPDDNWRRATACQTIANQERERIVKVQLPLDSKRVRE
jgi:hypothetical protein